MTDLARLHARLLAAMIDIDRVCTAHGLGYSLIAGSLLGAVRHEGFIPWDDDLDIGLLREDFDRFVTLAPAALGPGYVVQAFPADPHMGFPYAKVRVQGTTLREAVSADTGGHKGVFVDVFPFDNVPDDALAARAQGLRVQLLGALVLARTGVRNWTYGSPAARAVKRHVVRPVAGLMPRAWLARRMDRAARAWNGRPTRCVTATGGSYGYRRESVPRAWVAEVERVPFGGASLLASRHRHAWLAYLYGDYMTPPPPEKRVPRHTATELRLDDAP